MRFLISLLTIVHFLNAAAASEAYTFSVAEVAKKVTMEVDGEFPVVPGTDVLFVVDDSGSMSSYQDRVAQSLEDLSHEIINSGNDFHIGVTSTSDSGFSGPIYKLGQLRGNPTFITTGTPDFASIISKHLKLGTEGGGQELLFAPTLNALTPPLIDTFNKGFLRKDASLAVIFLTDTDDQDDKQMSPLSFAYNLSQIKSDSSQISLQAIIIPSDYVGDQACQRDGSEMKPARIEEAVRIMNGEIYNLCSVDIKSDMSAMVAAIFPGFDGPYVPGADISRIALAGKPDTFKPITVHFGNQEIPYANDTGWTYDSANNEILIGPNVTWKPQSGAKIMIRYTLR